MRYSFLMKSAEEAVPDLVKRLGELLRAGSIQRYRITGEPPRYRLSVWTAAAAPWLPVWLTPSKESREALVGLNPNSDGGEDEDKLRRAFQGHDMWGRVRASLVVGSLEFEARRAYFEATGRFLHTKTFRRLSRRDRAIWRLHASGATQREIAAELKTTNGSVARVIARLRPLAGLGRA